MKANELRIGNYINGGGCPRIVISIEKDGCISEPIDNSTVDFSKGIEPIPLTEEWLVKFGWELTPLNASFKRYNRKSGFMIIEVYDDNKFWAEYIYVKYVHQLQNLYFSLTGEELEIKNP